MLINTGVSLRSLNTRDLFDATYALMSNRSRLTEEEVEALDKLDKAISDSAYETDTGMPAITQWIPPANLADLPEGAYVAPDVDDGVDIGASN